jgi:hypothetical protein
MHTHLDALNGAIVRHGFAVTIFITLFALFLRSRDFVHTNVAFLLAI